MAINKHEKHNLGQVVISANHPNKPEPREIDVALVLANHYGTTVEFIAPIDDYRRKSADIKMFGVEWEIKCPIGKSKSTIRNQFRRASKQSKNIIIDARRTKLVYEYVEKEVLLQIRERPYIKKVVIIDKSEKVLEMHVQDML